MSIFSARHRIKILLLCVIVLMTGGGFFFSTRPQAETNQPPPQASAWGQRCNENDKSKCEAYWRRSLPETGQRVAEFAIGFPDDKKTARGVMILPLGILLTEDIQMQVDEGLSFKFKVKFCDPNGCVAYLNLNQKALDALRKGTLAVVTMKSAQGRDVRIEVPLAGLSRTLDTLS